METSIIKNVGQVAGIGGIALGILLIIFRDVIRRDAFSKLTKEHSYKIFRLILILTFMTAILGLSAWLFSHYYQVSIRAERGRKDDSVTITNNISSTESSSSVDAKSQNDEKLAARSINQSPTDEGRLGASALSSSTNGEKQSQLFNNYHVFIVATQDYKYSESDLRFVENDAYQLHSVLVNSGYPAENIKSYINARLEDFRSAMAAWIKNRSEGDSVIIYLAGHGISIGGLGYYVPGDAKIGDLQQISKESTGSRDIKVAQSARIEKTLFSLGTLATMLQSCDAGQKLLILDICSPETTRLNAEIGLATKSSIGLVPDMANNMPTTFATIASCRDDELSYESVELKQGVFTYWLCRGLAGHADRYKFGNSDKIISLSEIAQYVFQNVVEYSRHIGHIQHPVLKGHHIEGPMNLTQWDDEKRLPSEWRIKATNGLR